MILRKELGFAFKANSFERAPDPSRRRSNRGYQTIPAIVRAWRKGAAVITNVLRSVSPRKPMRETSHRILYMRDQLGELDTAVAIGVAVFQRVEHGPG